MTVSEVVRLEGVGVGSEEQMGTVGGGVEEGVSGTAGVEGAIGV